MKYVGLRQFAQAEKQFRRVVEIEPSSANALADLGGVLHKMRRETEAIELFERALSIDPKHKVAHETLFLVYEANRQPKGALLALRNANAAFPKRAALTKRLAWMLATTPDDDLRDPQEALRLAESEISTDGGTADDLAVLAAAHAANGNFERAVEIAAQAVSIARERGDTRAGPQIQEQLDLYRSGNPYRE